jgi:hypothetical protein
LQEKEHFPDFGVILISEAHRRKCRVENENFTYEIPTGRHLSRIGIQPHHRMRTCPLKTSGFRQLYEFRYLREDIGEPIDRPVGREVAVSETLNMSAGENTLKDLIEAALFEAGAVASRVEYQEQINSPQQSDDDRLQKSGRDIVSDRRGSNQP